MSEESLAKPLVSVVVPVCNVERYLGQCLEALMAQTLDNIEILAIDDGSTDSSPEILAHYAAIDARIRVITKPNEGYGATVNRGIDEACADYVGIVESDDYPEPTMFEKLHRAAVLFDADLVKCDFFDTFENGEQPRYNLSSLPHGVAFDPADRPEIVMITPSIWAALYRRSMLDEHKIRCRMTPGAAFQDTSFALRCLTSARRCALVAAPLLHYRRDNPNASTQSTDKVFTVADEFAYARKCLSCEPARYGKFIGHMRLNEWRTHRWDAMRVAEDARGEYFARVRDEFEHAERAGEIDESLFEPAELSRLKALLDARPSELPSFDAADAGRPRLSAADRARDLIVSVVIPAHNDAALIARAVGSCVGQSHRAVEVICVNDGSSDGTLDEMHRLAGDDPRVKVVNLEHNALTHNARLAGIREATGDLVTFLDADDELDASACERIACEFARKPFDVLQFGIAVASDGKADVEAVRDMERWCRPPRGALGGVRILVSAFVDFAYAANLAGKAFGADMARAAFESLGAVDADFGEDQMEYFAIACRARTYRGLRKNLYRYHLGDGESAETAMTARDFARPLRGIRAIEGIYDFLERSQLLPEFEGVYEVHRLGQLNYLLRMLDGSVIASDKPACLAAIEKEWGFPDDDGTLLRER